MEFAGGTAEGHEPPAELARRLFAHDDGIDHVHVLSNTVSVRRGIVWDEAGLVEAADVISGLFIHYPPADSFVSDEQDEALRAQHYNATLSEIRAHNEDLWVMMVRPDEPVDPYLPGQYTTLALGYWEPRSDEASEELPAGQRAKLARRSYSISSSMVDDARQLAPAPMGRSGVLHRQGAARGRRDPGADPANLHERGGRSNLHGTQVHGPLHLGGGPTNRQHRVPQHRHRRSAPERHDPRALRVAFTKARSSTWSASATGTTSPTPSNRRWSRSGTPPTSTWSSPPASLKTRETRSTSRT